ncbi:MAG TPA: DUF2252 domain-containing protein [Rubrivivax sp.]|nr:DUF2252 domain-containing protein [Rubrivivax sp.]
MSKTKTADPGKTKTADPGKTQAARSQDEAGTGKAEAKQAKAETRRAKAEAKQAKAEARQAKADAKKAKAEAKKARAEAKQAKAAAAVAASAPDPVPEGAFAPPIRVAYLDKPAHLRTRRERQEAGRALRVACPREAHAEYRPAARRRDPVQQLIDSSVGRIEHLVPIRYGRMAASPFAFFRGAAAIMAADLEPTPATGQIVQACGDCHLLNFGAFATPERRVIFDINDFDETHPAPWEWDLKRLAASFAIASLHNGDSPGDAKAAVRAAVLGYAERLAALAAMPTLQAWYDSVDDEEAVEAFGDKAVQHGARKLRAKAMARSADVEFHKLAQDDGDVPRIRDTPPLIFHPDEWRVPGFADQVRADVAAYRDSLPPERRVLLDRYELADVAMKVVGVGSVGTICGVAMLFAAEDDPLFLQLKQARPSVLAPHVNVEAYATEGARVVFGQRLMQASSDLFLGHLVSAQGTHLYVRQLRDVKIKPQVELYRPGTMCDYARLTGWALARAHARSGDPALLSGYVGGGQHLADALADFALAYERQNAADHQALLQALRDGRLEAVFEGA